MIEKSLKDINTKIETATKEEIKKAKEELTTIISDKLKVKIMILT